MPANTKSSVSKNTMKAIVKGSIILIAVPLVPVILIVGYFLLFNNANKVVTDIFTSPDNSYVLYTVTIENESTYNETDLEVISSQASSLPVVGEAPPKGGSTLINGYESYVYDVVWTSEEEFTVRITEPAQTVEYYYVYSGGSFVKYNELVIDDASEETEAADTAGES